MRKSGKIIKCAHCGKKKYKQLNRLKRSKNLFCSVKCKDDFKVKKVEINCAFCGKKIKRVLSRVKRQKRFSFCDSECMAKGYKGINLSGFFKKGNKGEKCINFRNGTQEENGYIAVLAPDHPHAQSKGYVYQHRLVMEKHIGRYLTPEEVVHHIDFDRKNNSIDNLMLFENDVEHHRHHAKLRKQAKQ